MLQAQISQSDMPSAGDTMRYSVTAAVGIQPGNGGTNTTWNFTDLQSASQYVDEFLSLTSAPFTYVAVFGLPFSPNYCDMARLDNSAFQIPQIPVVNITVEDVYNFYKSQSDGFEQRGFGASINGFPLPITYSDGDVLVPLPLTASTTQSNSYSFNATIPTIGYYGRDAQRINEADGTGTLRLPMGDYQCIRLRSQLVYSDSVALDALGFGFQLPEITETRYKWMAPGFGWPLLEITTITDPILGMETTSRVVYRDTLAIENQTGIEENNLNAALSIYPNPAAEVLMVKLELNESVNGSVSVMNSLGQNVYEKNRQFVPGQNLEIIPIEAARLASGCYFLRISTEKGQIAIKPFIVPNK
ncbi:MAG: T9SS type A sorting domain-containing protein [Bacteroidia bacterium]